MEGAERGEEDEDAEEWDMQEAADDRTEEVEEVEAAVPRAEEEEWRGGIDLGTTGPAEAPRPAAGTGGSEDLTKRTEEEAAPAVSCKGGKRPW